MKVGQRIHGVPVLGTRYQIGRIIEKHRPHEVLIAVSRSDPKLVRSMVRVLEPFKIPIKTMPNLHGSDAQPAAIRSVTIDDLLTRAPIDLDMRRISRLVRGRRVLITGAGGSIGGELARQVAALDPSALVLLDRYENGLYALLGSLAAQSGGEATPVIADVTDPQRIRAVFAEHTPEIVFHAAAHKHVPLMEQNPCEAVKNNIVGTRLVADAAVEAGARRFVLISTDKAVNPASVMGASKRVAELIVEGHARTSGTAFAVVRFGNVLGSNGSVVPLFLEQIANGGPVTVTHPEMRRYFMSIREAVQLVLHAAAIGEDGETFVLEMGEPLRLLELARDLIRLAGFVPDREIPIIFTGVRRGEKLDEDVAAADEVLEPAGIEKILRVRALGRPAADLGETVARLERHAGAGDVAAVLQGLEQLVPSFVRGKEPTAKGNVTPIECAPTSARR
jgi:FlaA1/EpsC-like NDP-sugar epimerase